MSCQEINLGICLTIPYDENVFKKYDSMESLWEFKVLLGWIEHQ